MNQNLTKGPVMRSMFCFALPMIAGNLLQQCYNIADTLIVGKTLGTNALAAVGSSFTLMTFVTSILLGLSMGSGAVFSIYFGSRDEENLKESISASFLLIAIFTVCFNLLSFACLDWLRAFLHVPSNVWGSMREYLSVIFCGIAAVSLYNYFASFLRAIGNSLVPLLFLGISSVLNIILDLWFVAGFHMGVAGVALATVIAQLVSALMCFLKLCRMTDLFDLKLHYLKPNRENILTVLRLGLPSGVTQAIFSLAMVVVQSLTNSFGELVIAANVIIMRVDGFAMMPNFSFGTAMTTYSGQNVGAGKIDRVKQGAKQGTLIAVGTSAVITALILVFGRYLMAIFTSTEELVVLSANMMKILAAGYIAMAVTQSLSGVMRGAGDTMTPMWISMITTVLIRVPLAYGIAYLTRTPEAPQGSYTCIFISLLCSWVLGAVITAFCYRMGNWKKKALK